MIQRDECTKCGLYKTCRSPQMEGEGSDNPSILFAGEAPGQDEDKTGRPFVGKAGKILRDVIEAFELAPEEYYITNVVRCRPPENRTPKAREMAYCIDFTIDEIASLNPKVVVLLGNSPLRAILNENGVTEWNGATIERDGIVYVPAFHPSFFNYGNKERLDEWIGALQKAVDIARNGMPDTQDDSYRVTYPKSTADLQRMLMEILGASGVVAYDIEAAYLQEHRPDNKILSVALSIQDRAWAFPVDHSQSWWTDKERTAVHDILDRILSCPDIEIIGHNVRFDCKMTRELLHIDFKPAGDTMRVSQLVDSKPGIHGLKRLAALHLGMQYANDISEYVAGHPDADYGKGGTYANVPLDILLPYNANDAIATHKLYPILLGQMTDTQAAMYAQMIMPVDYELGVLETNGFLVDKYMAHRYWCVYQQVRDIYYNKLLTFDEVKKLIRRRQRALDEDYADRLAKSKTKRLLKKPDPFVFNPNSDDQIRELLYVILKYKPTVFTDTGLASVAMDVLKLSDFKDHPMFETYRRWTLLSSMISKYLYKMSHGMWDVGDDRVRSSFNLGGAETGRLSSSSPNLQNIPTPEKEPGTLLAALPIKNIFTHTWEGGCLLSVDYAGMELRVMASLARCRGLIELFERGGDPHRYVTSQLYNIPEEEVTKEQRYRGKWVNWTMLYMGDEHTLYNTYNLPLKEGRFIVKTYFERFPEIRQFQQDTIDFAERNGYVETPFGRRAYFPYILDSSRPAYQAKDRRSACNMPIQGTASDILLCALIMIGDKMRQQGLRTMVVNIVHDDLVFDVYPGELDVVAELVVDVMENIADYAPEYFPDMSFDWLCVPLIADCEIGEWYGALSEYQKGEQ